jgi:catechol 2,3-dioxygenase-like lactoylglutathione lyase family enzyme
MSRLHVHLHVRDLDQSIRFYSTLFALAPTRIEPGYAKWMLDDPRVNFAISEGGAHEGAQFGIGHLGIQVDSDDELADRSARAKAAAGAVMIERGAQCCYATGNKAWSEDPQGVKWETFLTTGTLSTAGEGADETFIERDGKVESLDSPACGCVSTKTEETRPAACCA